MSAPRWVRSAFIVLAFAVALAVNVFAAWYTSGAPCHERITIGSVILLAGCAR